MQIHESITVELRCLHKAYREATSQRSIFHALDLNIPAGQFLALLGRSGSGKSTLLNLLAGIDTPDGGEVYLNGHNLTAMDERARTRFRRRHIGFVFQFFNLIPTLNAGENTRLPLELNGLQDALHEQHHQALLHDVGLAHRHASYPEQLSGGEQQRLALVRALVHRPGLLLADEPTGNLDEVTGQQILALLHRLTRETPTTVVMVTHSREVAALADRRLWLHEGQLEPLP